jgi:hypothetical protein
VQTNWTNRLLEIFNLRHAYSEQVRICIEIGLSCVQEDPHKRPTIQDIVNMLEETETECTDAAKKDLMLNNTEAKWGIYEPDDLPHDSRVILYVHFRFSCFVAYQPLRQVCHRHGKNFTSLLHGTTFQGSIKNYSIHDVFE